MRIKRLLPRDKGQVDRGRPREAQRVYGEDQGSVTAWTAVATDGR